jgi:hypothetical protein
LREVDVNKFAHFDLIKGETFMSKLTKERVRFEVQRVSDAEAVVKFPSWLGVGQNIDADKLLVALMKYHSDGSATSGRESVKGCCGHNGCCVHW